MTVREDRENDKMSRENLGKFFYDLAKASFTTMVITNVVTMFISESYILAIVLFFVGIISTTIFARIGYKIIKK